MPDFIARDVLRTERANYTPFFLSDLQLVNYDGSQPIPDVPVPFSSSLTNQAIGARTYVAWFFLSTTGNINLRLEFFLKGQSILSYPVTAGSVNAKNGYPAGTAYASLAGTSTFNAPNVNTYGSWPIVSFYYPGGLYYYRTAIPFEFLFDKVTFSGSYDLAGSFPNEQIYWALALFTL